MTSADEPELTHLDPQGRAHMVDVGGKAHTLRVARAEGTVVLTPALRQRLWAGDLPKGEVLAVARIAAIQGAKETGRLIPLCHPLGLDSVAVEFEARGDDAIRITAETRCTGPTGVEMEALTAVSIAALTIYDMCKGVEKSLTITDVRLLSKSGGRSGDWRRPKN